MTGPNPSDPNARPLAVLAVGGNTLVDEIDSGSHDQQIARAERVVGAICHLVDLNYRVLLVHGNGPQVGFALQRNELSSHRVAELPLVACVASTQGTLGFALELGVRNCRCGGHSLKATTVLTQVLVDSKDSAFASPSKPVGSFYDESRAQKRIERLGWLMVEDSGRGWRRVVASPAPKAIINLDSIAAALQFHDVVIAGGGGGVPVARDEDGALVGVDAVIDKDRTAALLGARLGASRLIVLTPVSNLEVDFGLPEARPLYRISTTEAARYLAEGQFPPGSMGPKVQATIAFCRHTGGTASIGVWGDFEGLVDGSKGSHIAADA